MVKSITHEDKNVVSLAVSKDPYSIIRVLPKLENAYNKICYVTLDKPCFTFREYFEKHRLNQNKFFFIDCITKSIMKTPPIARNCKYLEGPHSLERINSSLRDIIRTKKVDIIIFDSLSTMLNHEKESFVLRFIHKLVPLIRDSRCKGIFIMLEEDMKTYIGRDIGMLMDNTVYLK